MFNTFLFFLNKIDNFEFIDGKYNILKLKSWKKEKIK